MSRIYEDFQTPKTRYTIVQLRKDVEAELDRIINSLKCCKPDQVAALQGECHAYETIKDRLDIIS